MGVWCFDARLGEDLRAGDAGSHEQDASQPERIGEAEAQLVADVLDAGGQGKLRTATAAVEQQPADVTRWRELGRLYDRWRTRILDALALVEAEIAAWRKYADSGSGGK